MLAVPALFYKSPSFLNSTIALACVLTGLCIVSVYNFLLFHTLAELFSILIAAMIFMIAWNSRERLDNGYFIFLGMAYLAVAVLDLLHTLAYKGMGIFPGRDANLPTQLWIATRYLESLSLLAAPVFLTARGGVWAGFGVWGLGLAVIAGTFWWGVFPDCYLEGQGLTTFKIASEYLICLILGGAGLFLYKRRSFFEGRIFALLLFSLAFTVLSELCFTFYVSVYGLSNLVGHFFKLIGFYLIYRALIITGFKHPQELLFQKLERSEALLRTTSALAKVGGWELDLPSGGLNWTDGVYRIYEMPGDQRPSLERATACFHPEDRPRLLKACEDAKQRGVPHDLELRFTTTQGGQLWTRTIIEPLRSGGEVAKLQGAIQDITNHKQNETSLQRQQKALRQQSLQLRKRVKELSCLYAIHEAAHTQAARDELFGRVLELIPQGWQLPGSIGARIIFDQEHYGRQPRAEPWDRQEAPIMVGDRQRGSLEVFAAREPGQPEADPFLSEERDLIQNIALALGGAMASLETAQLKEQNRRELERRVAEQTTELQKVIAQLERQRFLLGERVKELHCLYEINEAANTLARKEDLFHRALQVIPGGWQHPARTTAVISFDQEQYGRQPETERHSKLVAEILVEGSQRGSLAVFLSEGPEPPEGEPFLPEERALIKSIALALAGAVDALEIEEEKEKTRVELERSNRELQQFAYVASHDLQEPLRMVSSYMQLLQRRYQDKLDDDANEFIGFAVDGAARMKQLIQDLLAFSRVTTRGGEMQPTDSGAALDLALQNLQTLLMENQAEVTPGELPRVTADPGQLAQVFQNLVQNAVKFRGPEPPRIEVAATRGEDEWVFSVSDNGVGIEPRYFDRIFIIYQRLASKAELGGTGIGLALVKKIVERHGGRVWVESSLGTGSTFYFNLPEGSTGHGD